MAVSDIAWARRVRTGTQREAVSGTGRGCVGRFLAYR